LQTPPFGGVFSCRETSMTVLDIQRRLLALGHHPGALDGA
jgi:hypothetical protein